MHLSIPLNRGSIILGSHCSIWMLSGSFLGFAYDVSTSICHPHSLESKIKFFQGFYKFGQSKGLRGPLPVGIRLWLIMLLILPIPLLTHRCFHRLHFSRAEWQIHSKPMLSNALQCCRKHLTWFWYLWYDIWECLCYEFSQLMCIWMFMEGPCI